MTCFTFKIIKLIRNPSALSEAGIRDHTPISLKISVRINHFPSLFCRVNVNKIKNFYNLN